MKRCTGAIPWDGGIRSAAAKVMLLYRLYIIPRLFGIDGLPPLQLLKLPRKLVGPKTLIQTYCRAQSYKTSDETHPTFSLLLILLA